MWLSRPRPRTSGRRPQLGTGNCLSTAKYANHANKTCRTAAVARASRPWSKTGLRRHSEPTTDNRLPITAFQPQIMSLRAKRGNLPISADWRRHVDQPPPAEDIRPQLGTENRQQGTSFQPQRTPRTQRKQSRTPYGPLSLPASRATNHASATAKGQKGLPRPLRQGYGGRDSGECT